MDAKGNAMKAIILTAGQGSRMRPLTHDTHKALLTVAGKSILRHVVDSLLMHGIRDIVIVLGYQAEEIQAHLDTWYPDLSFSYVTNDRFMITNNIVSLSLALNAGPIDQDILLIECDLVVDPSVIERVIQSPYPDIALVGRYRTGMDGTVLVLSGNLITDVVTPQRQGEDFVFSDKFKTINIYKFSKEFCNGHFRRLLNYYASTVENAYYELVLGVIIYLNHHPIYAEIIDDEKWIEVDTPNDLAAAYFMFEPSKRQSMLDQTFGGYWNLPILDFCFIRNMYFPTGAIYSELKSNLIGCIQNYGSTQSVLNRKLSYFLLCDVDRVLVLNGASQIFPIMGRFFSSQKVMIPTPTFGEYSKIFPNADHYPDLCTPGFPCPEWELYDVVVVVNPNNPTGTIFDSHELHAWAMQHPSTTLIVDESFIEFSGQPSLIAFLEDTPLSNVIIVKSLSKNLGIPGLRLGYVYTANPIFYAAASCDIPIWNMNSLAEYFLEIILRHRQPLALSYTKTIADREMFCAQLSTLSVVQAVYPSGGNFVLVKWHSDAPIDLEDALLSTANIYIKKLTKMTGGRYSRLAVRLPHENTLLIDAIKQIGGQT